MSGLSGSGLVLHSSAGDDLAVSANGAFVFPTAIARGSQYTVTVAQQPRAPAQTCAVTNGTGTMGDSGVTGVEVSCTTDAPPTFTVGGSVAGLAAGGTLVLRNNGTDAATITANGPYAFAAELASGATYAVTVVSNPAGQVCTVANGGGTLASGDVTNVDVTCTTAPVNTFTVGGSVEGLVGSGLVLHSDAGAGEDLPVAPNATTFQFTRQASSGATVNVTVKTRPSSPAQTCTVAGTPVTIGSANVESLRVSCTTAIQRWTAPASWGGRWPDSPKLLQHAYFDGTGIVETKSVSWTVANGTLPAQRALDALPSKRWGVGPFGAARYQATNDDSAFDLSGDMLVCAVVQPDYDPVQEGSEPVIIAKGIEGDSGWALIQRHHTFNFQYRYVNAALNERSEMAYTPTYFADASLVDNGPLNPSYVVVCAGRDGDTLRAAANSADTAIYPATIPAGATFKAATSHRLTIGGYDNGDANHGFGGRIYETAIWNEPATPENMQAKFATFFGLRAGERYTRNREAPFIGSDGQYHAAWRHAPRAYAPDPNSGFGGGFLFGLQGWNRLTQPYDPPAWDVQSQLNPVIAFGEDLSLWTPAGGAIADARQVAPPGDGMQNGAAKVTLPPQASLSAALGAFDSAGPIHGMMWIRPVTSQGKLRVTTSAPASGTTSAHEVDLATLPANTWSRVWLKGLTTDGTASSVTLANPGPTAIEFHGWGVDLTQIGRGGDLGTFDPGPVMYDWGGPDGDGVFALDSLQLPPVPASTATTGFCIEVDAQPPAGLDWTAPFVADRSPATWESNDRSQFINLFIGGTANRHVGDLCGYVSSTDISACWHPTWAPGSSHTIALCSTAGGDLTLYADGAAVATASGGAAPPDLAQGRVIVGANSAIGASNLATWQGFITRVAVCSSANRAGCN